MKPIFADEARRITRMNALEAKRLSEQAVLVKMDEIYEKIARAAGNGDKTITLACENYKEVQIPTIKGELEKNGYIVKRNKHSGIDYRDSWDNLEISWDTIEEDERCCRY